MLAGAAAAVAAGTRLVIAEKATVMELIASALGLKKVKSHYEGKGLMVTAASGHLVAVEGVPWTTPLPIFPKPFKLKAHSSASKLRLDEIRTLASRADVLVNGCDAGREGELIFRRICEFLRLEDMPFERLWLQSLTPAAIRSAMQSCRPGSDLDNLADAARRRSEADWLVGINATVALSKGNWIPYKTSVGRVMTPTLSMVVDREKEIQDFQPEPYLHVTAKFNVGADKAPSASYEGLHSTLREKGDGKSGKVDWPALASSWQPGLEGTIVEDVRGEVLEKPKPLLDLAELQRGCERQYKLTPSETLIEAQKLYLEELITYPRTDSRHLPEDYRERVREELFAAAGLRGRLHPKLLQQAADGVANAGFSIFDNSKVGDHFAIIPTEFGLKRDMLASKPETPRARVLEYIIRRYVAAFLPAAKFRTTKRITEVKGHLFKTTSRDLMEPGFLEIEGRKVAHTAALAVSQKGTTVFLAEKLTVTEQETLPPPRYTQATLLTAMETCGRKVSDDDLREGLQAGLGTAATRANHIEKLLKQQRLLPASAEAGARGTLMPDEHAMWVISQLRGQLRLPELASAELTGRWELSLRGVEKGDKSQRAIFDEGIRGMVERIVLHAARTEHDGSAPLPGRAPRWGVQGKTPAWKTPGTTPAWKTSTSVSQKSQTSIAASTAKQTRGSKVKVLVKGVKLKTASKKRSGRKKEPPKGLALQVGGLTVAELKKELRDLGLPAAGLKAELQSRLSEAIDSQHLSPSK